MRDPPEWKRPRQSQDSWGVTTVEGSKGAVGFQSNQQLRRNQKPYSHTSVLLPMQAPLYLRVRKNKGWATGFPGATQAPPIRFQPRLAPRDEGMSLGGHRISQRPWQPKRGEKTDGGSHSRYFATSWWFFWWGKFFNSPQEFRRIFGPRCMMMWILIQNVPTILISMNTRADLCLHKRRTCHRKCYFISNFGCWSYTSPAPTICPAIFSRNFGAWKFIGVFVLKFPKEQLRWEVSHNLHLD